MYMFHNANWENLWVCEEILKEVIKYLITGFFSFEVIIKLHFSIIKKGKKVIMNIDFFTKAN